MSLDESNMFDETKRYFNKERFWFYTPCIFIGKENNCMIYSSRSLICRTTGTGYTSKLDLLGVCHTLKVHCSIIKIEWI
jgi:Fe-S-cluster containining protein